MNTVKKLKSEQFISGCRCLSKGFGGLELIFNKSQLMLGRSKSADFAIEHASVAYYHALFLVIEDQIHILDLTPNQQLCINGHRTPRATLLDGDTISIGKLQFQFESNMKAEKFEELNEKLSKFSPPPPPLKVVPVNFLQHNFANPSLPITMVDGDACQLLLPEDEKWLKSIESVIHVDLAKDYIEASEHQDETFYPDKIKKLEEHLIISYLCSGQLVSMDTFSTKTMSRKNITTKNLSPELAQWWKKNDTIFSKQDKDIIFHAPNSFGGKEEKVVVDEKQTTITFGMHQIAFSKKIMRKDPNYKLIWRDQEEFFQGFCYFVAFIAPILLLLLVDIPEVKEPEKEQVVIYTTEVVEEEAESTQQSGGAVEMLLNKTYDTAAVAPQIDNVKGDQPKSDDKSMEKEVAEPKAAEQVASKFASLFSKTKVTTSEAVFEDGAEGGTGKSDGHLKALKGSGSGKASTVGGGQIKGLYVDGGLSGKKGFKSGSGVGRGDFDSGFTSTKTVVLGSIDPELLRKLLKEYIPQFRYCYQTELTRNPNLAGTVDLNFTINAKGKITKSNVTAKGTKFTAKGLNCMDGVLQMIPFPSPKGGGQVDVRQPLNFSAERTKL